MSDERMQILLVEDNPDDAEILRETLLESAANGFQLTHVERLEEARHHLADGCFDIVLLDLSLPDSQGFETFRDLQEECAEVAIIVLTGLDDEALALEAVQAGAQDYLVKGEEDGRLLVRAMRYAIERKRSAERIEKELHEKEAMLKELERQGAHIRRLSMAVEQSPAAAMITDIEGGIEYINAKFTEVTGYSLAEVLGENPRLLKSGKQSPDFYRELWQKIKGGEEWHGEFHNKKKNGELYWESASISPIRSAGGEITHFVAVKEDITERKQEEGRRLARQRMLDEVWKMQGPDDTERLLDGLKSGLETLGVPFYACEINLIDASAGGSPGTHSFSLLPSGEWRKIESEAEEGLILQIWRSGEPLYRSDLRREDLHREKEEIEDVYGSIRAVLDVPFSHGTLAVNSLEADAFPDRYIASLQVLAEVLSEGFRRLDDLQNLEEKENQLRQSQKMEAVGQLAGGVAHDFNNLITIITGYCQLLSKRFDPEDAAYQNIQEIYKSGERAATLVRQLLAFSRRQVLKPEVLDLNAVVADIDKMLRRLIGEDIDLITSGYEELGKVKADPGQLEQVIVNLAVNARDAMPEGGKLTIETANVELDREYADQHAEMPPGAYVLLAVSDNGMGMDGETRVRIFEPFFTTKEKGKGTGLGLSTVYGIVKQSNGFIWVYSEPGKGTTFKVYLPRIEGDGAVTQTEIAPEEKLEGTETILVVEDDDTVRELVQRIFHEYGYSVIEACDGEEGLQICAQQAEEIDLLLTDVVMPGMNGPELAEYVTSMKDGIKVLYMSGYADRAISHNGLVKEDIQFLQKPFTPEELLHKTRESLDDRSRESV
jgi:PAS domain S-box-containing protein